MKKPKKIIVHDGQAHVDDFLACCILLAKFGPNTSIERRKFTSDDLTNPDYWVVDQGLDHNIEFNNYDHHQWKGPPCAFTLLMDHLFGKEYRDYLNWPTYVETFDTSGPDAAGNLFQSNASHVEFTKSPIVGYFTDRFSKCTVPNNYLQSEMWSIGVYIVNSIIETKNQIKVLESSKVVECGDLKVLDIIGLGVTGGSEKLPTKTYCKIKGLDIDIILTNDLRNEGQYRMVRAKDRVINFKESDKTHFVHSSGFLVSFKKLEDWRDIIKESQNESSN